MIGGDGSLGSWYRKTIHSSSCRSNNDNKNSEEEGIDVSSGEESHENRCIETIHSSSCNSGGHESHGHRSQDTIRSTSSKYKGHGSRSSITIQSSACNCVGYVDRGGSRSQDTNQSSYTNRVTIVYVEVRGV